MIMRRVLLAVVFLALTLGLLGGTVVMAYDENSEDVPGVITELPEDVPAGVVGYYTEDAGKHWTPITQEQGIIERIPDGINKSDFMAAHGVSTKEEMAKFLEDQRKLLSEEEASEAGRMILSVYSIFYKDNFYYGGRQLALLAGYWVKDLAVIGMDNIFSSYRLSTASGGSTIFDYAYYGGDWFERPGGTNIPRLSQYGWNDRASSVICWPQ